MAKHPPLESFRALVLDVDGVLTDGRLWYESAADEWRRAFHIQDGLGLKALIRQGFYVGLITGSKSQDIEKRAAQLGFHAVHQGVEDKLPVFQSLLESWSVSAQQTVYVGDDTSDLPVLESAGWAVTVPNAHPELLKNHFHCTERAGGHGAVREICDRLIAINQKET